MRHLKLDHGPSGFAHRLADSAVKTHPNSPPNEGEPSVTPAPRGFDLIKAQFYRGGVDVAKPANSVSPAAVAVLDPHPISQTPLPRGARPNISTVVAVFLFVILPSLVLGAIVWFGMTAAPSTGAVTADAPAGPMPTHLAPPSPVLTTPGTLEATSGDTVAFPIALNANDTVPARSIIAVRGLPTGSTFSSGRPYGQTEWTLTPDEIGKLHLTLPEIATNDALTVELIGPDGRVLATSVTFLNVNANAHADVIVHTVTTQSIGGHHVQH